MHWIERKGYLRDELTHAYPTAAEMKFTSCVAPILVEFCNEAEEEHCREFFNVCALSSSSLTTYFNCTGGRAERTTECFKSTQRGGTSTSVSPRLHNLRLRN